MADSMKNYVWIRFWSLAMAFGTDAYDLFIAGAVVAIMGDELTTNQKAAVATVPIAGAIAGQVMGVLADCPCIGRKMFSLITISLVVLGALISAFSFHIEMLILGRFILGLGIGGEYPAVATIASETADQSKRGGKLLRVFSMQGIGALLAPCMALLFHTTVKKDLAWRFMLGIAALPAMGAAYLRWSLPETGIYTQLINDGQGDHGTPVNDYPGIQANFSHTKIAKIFAGTGLSWFLFDIVFYANGLFAPIILKKANISDDLNIIFLFQIVVALVALPGYWIAIYAIDKVGRLPLQYIGFIMMSLTYFIIGLTAMFKGVILLLFIICYSLSFFFANCGPNSTTFVLPVESFPTQLRARMHGFSAASGKTGALLGGIAMINLLDYSNIGVVFISCGIVAVLGVLVTLIFVKETKNIDIITMRNVS